MANFTQKNMYDAQIGDKKLRVDIYDLPYAEFNSETPLVIFGDVVLADKAKTTDLSNVRIMGNLDISKQKYAIIFPSHVQGAFICRSNPQMRKIKTKDKIDVFNTDFEFPAEITEIDCSHSIYDFTFLIQKTPSTVKKITVADAILTKLPGNEEQFNAAILFQQTHPDIVVVGEKKGQSLSQILEIQPAPVKKTEQVVENTQQQETKQEQVKQEPEHSVKTEDFCDENEIFYLLSADPVIKSCKTRDSTLRREIKRFLSKFDTETMIDSINGSVVICIKKADLQIFLETLKANLQKKAGQKATAKADTIQETHPAESDVPLQTEEYCNKHEILKACLDDADIYKLAGEDHELLVKKIRKYMKTIANIKVSLEPGTRETITCVLRSKLPLLLEKIKTELKEIQRKSKPMRHSAKTQKPVSKKQQPVVAKEPVVAQKPVVATKQKLIPIKIKKYIPQQIWKDICKACGKSNIDRQLFVLQTIDSVNVNVVETPQIDGLAIINPETLVQTMSSYMRHEDGQSLVQSIDSSWFTDNKRIVWSYLPKEQVLVCTGCCPEHNANKRENQKYSRIRDRAAVGIDDNGEKITMQKINEGAYLDVDVLLQDLLSEKTAIMHTDQEQTDTKPVISTQTTEEKITATRSGKRQRITINKVEKVNYVPHSPHVVNTPKTKETTKPIAEQQGKDTAENKQDLTTDVTPILIKPKEETIMTPKEKKTTDSAVSTIISIPVEPKNMTAVQAIQAYYQSILQIIENVANQGLLAASSEIDLAKKLKTIDDAREALVKKAELENLMTPEIQKICVLLKDFQDIHSK